MTKEQEDKIIAIASRSWLWSIPKKPSCLLDEVVIMMVENPEWALKQIPVIIDDDFWRSVWTENIINYICEI